MGREFRPQPFHVLAGPGLRTGERLAVEFDAAILDLVAPVSKIQAESVVEFELCLQDWGYRRLSWRHARAFLPSAAAIGVECGAETGEDSADFVVVLHACPALSLSILQWLMTSGLSSFPASDVTVRGQDIGLRSGMGDSIWRIASGLQSHGYEQIANIVALVAWLEEWPPAEPHRQGLCVSSGEISPELLELQLHSVLALLGEGGLLAALSEHQAVVDGFRSVAIAWIFKLHSLYGLEILSQHERVTAKSASHLSMLSWELFQVEELLQSPFFRPQEMSLWRFAKRWCVEGAGAPAFTEESEDAEGKVEVLPSPNKDEIDGAFSKVLLWDLLPPNEELVVQFAAAQAAAPAVEGELGTGRFVSASFWGYGADSMSGHALRTDIRDHERRMLVGSKAPARLIYLDLSRAQNHPALSGEDLKMFLLQSVPQVAVDAILKGFLTDYPTVIGFVVINSDGIPTKWHESMPYERAVIYAALMSDYIAHCKKCLKELLTGPAESELANVRLRTREGTEIIFVTLPEYTLAVIQPYMTDKILVIVSAGFCSLVFCVLLPLHSIVLGLADSVFEQYLEAKVVEAKEAPEPVCPTELSTGDPEAEEFQEPVEKSKASRPRRVDGSTFVRAERRADCVLKPFEDADALHLSYADDSTSLHCWNSAQELQVLGGSRQVLVSTVPMTSGGGGRFRFDFRLSSGSGADAAPLFEYMRRSSPQWDLAAMAAEGAPRWRDRGSGPRAPPAPRLPWRGRTREAAEHHGTHSHDPWDPWSIAAGRNPWSSGDFGDPWNGWATLDSENPWEDSWDGFAVHSSDTRPFFFAPLNEPLNVPPPSVPVHSREPGQLGPWRATSSGSQPGTGVNVRNLPRHDVPMPAPRIAFTEATRQDMGQSSLETTWMGSLRTEEPVILPPRAPPPSIPPPRPPYFEMSQVVFHRGDSFGHGRDRDSFVSGPPPGAPIPGPVPPIPPGLVFPGGVGLGVGVTVWDIGSVASLSSTRSLARGVIEAHTALYTFKQKDVRGEACDSASKKCCICLEDFVEGQQLRILPCFHRYHQCCIDEWLCRSDECPLCKFRITADDTALMDSIEVSSHGSATPRSPPLATIESGSEATEESVQGRDRFWSHAVGVNDAIHDDDFLNAGAWPPLRDERQAGSPSPAFIERTWDRFGGINTQVSNLTAAIQAEMHEAPGAHQ
ncbi:RNF43, partial [Symbiodinium necroappetens]